MKFNRGFWIAIAILVVWLVLTWFLGTWIGLHSPALYILRFGLWFLGIAGFVGYLLLRPKEEAVAETEEGAALITEIDFNFAEAGKRMRAAKGIKRLGTLPAVFLIGDSDSAKTTILAKSGLEAELLAGLAFDDVRIAPTRSLNIWYARDTLFVDPSGAVLADAGVRRKLFKKFAPIRLNAVVGGKLPAARSVVFTVDCETILQAGGAEALGAKARQFQTILTELSHELGSSFPVYVLFTKADKISYFRDFVDKLTQEEASEVLGATLPLLLDTGQGVYAEQQNRRIGEAFQDVFLSISDKRPEYLAREHDAPKLPNIYEFPREFSKMRGLLVRFLVDLCRPSQLGTSPFLRGFYFSGVRPVTVSDLASGPATAAPVEQAFDAGATRVFTQRPNPARMQAEVRETGSRKIPQWVYLAHLFPDVVLRDRPAVTVTQRNVKVNFLRRVMLAAAAAAALFVCAWFTVSYLNNNALISDATDAAKAVPPVTYNSGQLASADVLERLTRVKSTLAVLNEYDDNPPFRYGAFLYSGNAIREPLRITYYALFRKILLAPVQSDLVSTCTRPDASASAGYGYIYDDLKSYLITTNHHEKSTQVFLAPALLTHWEAGQQVDPPRQDLARQNFEFYAQDLAQENPYPRFANPDSTAVANCRAYLNKLPPEERIYHAMLDAAKGTQRPINFNIDYPDSRKTIVNAYTVDAAFSKTGYENFNKQLQNPDKYLYGEQWVLGELAPANYDKSTVLQAVAGRYKRDFIKTWTTYLNATSIVPYKDVPDAGNKLAIMSTPPSPLMQVLCVASENTSANKDAAQAFQPVQSVTPKGCIDSPINGTNKPYIQSLSTLGLALQTVGRIDTAVPANVDAANAKATDALTSANSLILNFVADPNDPKVTVLNKTGDILKDPITRVQALLKGAAAGPINAAAGGACASISPILRKYPFDPRSKEDATLQEVNDFLNPQTGKLWQLYNNNLKTLLLPAGNDYVPAQGQQAKITQPFLNFFNRAAHLSQALYGANPAQPSLTFTVQALPTPDVDHVLLLIDGQTLDADTKSGTKQTFTWPGTAPGVDLKVTLTGGSQVELYPSSNRLWELWHFVEGGEQLLVHGNELQFEWIGRNQSGAIIKTGNGNPEAIKLSLGSQNSQVFLAKSFSGMSCVSKAAE